MRLLIYGAGVIGSLYAVLFSEAGIDTTVYARGHRLEVLQSDGLLYYKKGTVTRAEHIKIVSEVKDSDRYDYIFLPVRENQLKTALKELQNTRGSIVTLVNSIEDYRDWENICGKGRVIPAFPGAGGSISENILDAALTPALVQPTTFGEISGEMTERVKELRCIFHRAGIPCQVVKDMHLWQLCHLALVVPIADAYYETEQPEKAGYDKKLMLKTAKRLKRNFHYMKLENGHLSPAKMNLFLLAPAPLISCAMSVTFRSRFGDKFMYRHSMKAPDEMRTLHRQLYTYMKFSSQTAEQA